MVKLFSPLREKPHFMCKLFLVMGINNNLNGADDLWIRLVADTETTFEAYFVLCSG